MDFVSELPLLHSNGAQLQFPVSHDSHLSDSFFTRSQNIFSHDMHMRRSNISLPFPPSEMKDHFRTGTYSPFLQNPSRTLDPVRTFQSFITFSVWSFRIISPYLIPHFSAVPPHQNEPLKLFLKAVAPLTLTPCRVLRFEYSPVETWKCCILQWKSLFVKKPERARKKDRVKGLKCVVLISQAAFPTLFVSSREPFSPPSQSSLPIIVSPQSLDSSVSWNYFICHNEMLLWAVCSDIQRYKLCRVTAMFPYILLA